MVHRWFPRFFLLVPAALIGTACSRDSTGPESNVTVQVTLTKLTGPSVSDLGNGDQRIECDIELQAVVAGEGRATWNDATLLFYAGSDRSTPVDSTIISQSDIRSSWQASDIGPGEPQVSGWRIFAAVPFAAALVYRYSTGGTVRSSRVAFTCGPDVSGVHKAPAVSAVSIQPTGDDIELGAVLTVHYLAQSSVGLWASAVKISGACAMEQHFSERFSLSSEHDVAFTIPAGCPLGGSLSVEIDAIDAALLTTSIRLPRSLAVVDRTRPYVYADHLPGDASYFFAGDTLQPFVAASDNGVVRTITWEVQPFGVRDSISGFGGRFVNIPIRPEWVGTAIRLRFWSRDAAGLLSDTMVAPAAGLPIYATAHPSMRTTTITGDIEGVAVDEKRGALYFLQMENSARIGVFSLASMSLTEQIPQHTVAWDLELTPGGDSLILAMPYERALGIIDLRESPRVTTLLPLQSLAPGQAPWRLRIGANGKAYVVLEGTSPTPTGLLEVDLATGVERLVPGSEAIAGARFERSFDRSTFIFERGTDYFQRYDVLADQFGPVRTAQGLYGPLRVDNTAARITVGLDVYDGSLDFLRRMPSVYGGEAMPGSALSRDGAYVYHALGFRGVARTRTSDGAVLDRFVVPFSASGFLSISPDGNTLIVVDSFQGTARIALVDLR